MRMPSFCGLKAGSELKGYSQSPCINLSSGRLSRTRTLACAVSDCALSPRVRKFNDFKTTYSGFSGVHYLASGCCACYQNGDRKARFYCFLWRDTLPTRPVSYRVFEMRAGCLWHTLALSPMMIKKFQQRRIYSLRWQYNIRFQNIGINFAERSTLAPL